MKPYYEEAGITIYHGDCRDFANDFQRECLILDPPWDRKDLYFHDWNNKSVLGFADGRTFDQLVKLFSYRPIAWVFTWDCMNTWQSGPHRPVQQAKFCVWFGSREEYQRDGALWGNAPPDRNHPTTRQKSLAGRRMTDVWRESLRWLHNPTAGNGSMGTERFARRGGENPYRHAKPEGWLRCLIANCSQGAIFDPFMGTGTSLVAAKSLGRRAIGIEIEEKYCEIAAKRLSQGVLFGVK